MKTLKNFFSRTTLVVGLICLLYGCGNEQVSSENLYEEAIVEDIIYSPGQHGSGSTVSIDTNGDVGFGATSIETQPQYAIVFKCPHGRFVIQGESEKYMRYWKTFHSGQRVKITYKEIYEIEDGRRHLVDYDFIDATAI